MNAHGDSRAISARYTRTEAQAILQRARAHCTTAYLEMLNAALVLSALPDDAMAPVVSRLADASSACSWVGDVLGKVQLVEEPE